MIPEQAISDAGGDWSGYGEATGQALLDLIQGGKISIVFANNALLVGVELADGQTGYYQLPHVKDLANFS